MLGVGLKKQLKVDEQGEGLLQTGGEEHTILCLRMSTY